MEKTYGWTGTLLSIGLPSGEVNKTRSMEYAKDFIGGRLLASRIYWDEVGKAAGALDPENVLMIMPGPLTGTPAIACSRWVISAKSPHSYPDQYGFGNGGGFLGAALKHAGYDGLIVRGRAKTPTYILIENDRVKLEDGRGLWGLTCDETMKKLKECYGSTARIVCIGPAGENMVRFATASSDQGAVLSNGMGAVMGSKNLKAVVVRGSNKVAVADPKRLTEVNRKVRFLRKGLNESVHMHEPMIKGVEKVRLTPCYGCPAGCMRASYKHTSGLEEVRKTCFSAVFYLSWDRIYHGKATETPFLATSLCDRFGLCTSEVNNIIRWLYQCFRKGLLSEEETGLPLSRIGSLEFIETLVDQIVTRKGFGELLAQGTRRASIEKGKAAEEVALARITPSGYNNDSYGARVFLITSLIYATEPRNPTIQLHEVNFTLVKWALWYSTSGTRSPITTDDLRTIAARAWGSEKAVDFSTCDGKAKAAFMIQNREHAKESMVACDRYYPLLDTEQQENHVGDPTLVPQLFQAVTGRELSEDDYYQLGERSVNLQRAILGREGRVGREEDALGEFNFTEPVQTCEGVFGMVSPNLELPGAGDEVISRKGKTLDRSEFERMKDEFYLLRGWDVGSGMQTREKLQELGLGFLCSEMEPLGLLKTR